MTLGELRTRCKLFLNVNDSQLDDSISVNSWAAIIQQAYADVWGRMRGQVSRASILVSTDLTWPAGQQTMTLPTNLWDAVIYDIWQLDGSGNPLIQFNAFFETRNVLRNPSISWNAAGYQLRVYYIPEVEALTSDSSTPRLIPLQYHSVIVWEALRIVKMLYDKEIPPSWEKKMEEIEYVMVKEQSTRPVAQRANIVLATNPMARPLAAATL